MLVPFLPCTPLFYDGFRSRVFAHCLLRGPSAADQGRVDVMAAVIDRDGKLLLCQRPEHKRYGGLWEFPGGKVEPGESRLEAVRRELAEELGIEVLSVGETRLAVPDPASHFVIQFADVEIDGQPIASEHSNVAWVAPQDLLSLPLAPSDRVFAETLIRGEEAL